MRRLFHGRMITVDGHMRRMDENYNKFVILNDSKVGYQLEQKRIQNSQGTKIVIEDSDIRNTKVIPCKPNTTYSFHLMKSGYELYVTDLTSELIVISNGAWGTTSFTTSATAAYISINLAVGSEHTADITVGDCGVLITEE